MLADKNKYNQWVYKCECLKCGYIKFSNYGTIAGPKSVSHFCKHRRANGEFRPYIKGSWDNKRIERIFHNMMKRCYNQNHRDYKWYGAKGIGVCDEWRSNPFKFEEWALSNGYTDNLTIDRIDSNKDYCPENCQWIPLDENARRAGKVNWIIIDNNKLTGKQWANRLGLGVNTINKAIREYGINKTKELISTMLKVPPSTKHRESHQTWFSVYGIEI